MKGFIAKIKKRIREVFSKIFQRASFSENANLPGYIDIIENKYGHKLTREKGIPLDRNERPLPWFTYPAIEYLDQLDLSNCNIFEWGLGNSSLFFAERAKKVFSIEHNLQWFDIIQHKKLANNNIFIEEDNTKYVNRISVFDIKFDIIIIDGKEREACADICYLYLTQDGLIILDNSDRNPDIAEKFRKLDFLQIDMHGFGPVNNYTWTTSFFFKRTARFKPKENQPTIPIGGGY
jgi:hypothetical protein